MNTTEKPATLLTVSLSPAFKLVFLSVLGLTILAHVSFDCAVGIDSQND